MIKTSNSLNRKLTVLLSHSIFRNIDMIFRNSPIHINHRLNIRQSRGNIPFKSDSDLQTLKPGSQSFIKTFQATAHLLLLAFSLVLSFIVSAQPNTTINLDSLKPKQYQERKLTAEKSTTDKLKPRKKFFQNLFSHYNYYFNADNKLNDIIARAKMAFKEDYTQLLPFYNYTLDATAKDKQQLDSVIYKCYSGLLLHDLRSDWNDDLYLLLGKAYLLRKDFDSATQVYQYINYIFAPKDDGYDIYLGSNASNTNGIFTVSTKEDKKLIHRITTKAPARNECFLWQVRTYLEQNKLDAASGLLPILRSDPYFPARLQSSLHEMLAYSFYKEKFYDSAAWHLQRALKNAFDEGEKARWEYLCGQLYQLAKKTDEAIFYFHQSIQHTIDPYLEVYARLNIVSLSSAANKENAIQQNLAELYKLAKKDRYENYRDIIYYAAAVLQLQQHNISAAKNDLSKSIRLSVDNPGQKAKSIILLADVDYKDRQYIQSSDLYDSLKTNLIPENEKEKIGSRKAALQIICKNLNTLHVQDSLLALAFMGDAERMAAIKLLNKRLLKEQGLKESEEDLDFGRTSGLLNGQNQGSLFNNSSIGTNDFYFNNPTSKAQGFTDFKTIWGNRPNVDNWNRQSALTRSISSQNNSKNMSLDVDQAVSGSSNKKKVLSMKEMLANIPLTEKKKTASYDSIASALYSNGQVFQNKLEEPVSAIGSYSGLLTRFPDYKQKEKVLFNMAYCYLTTGQIIQFDSIKALMNKNYPQGSWTYRINKGEFLNNNDSTVSVASFTKEYINREYETIYNLFIEGHFEEAKQEKQNADHAFGNKYWTPQLLFIESVYYIKQKEDGIAIQELQTLIKNFGKTPLAERAKTMIDVLKRRKEIENYLTNLNLDKNEDSTLKRVDLDQASVIGIRQNKNINPTVSQIAGSPALKPAVQNQQLKIDSSGIKKIAPAVSTIVQSPSKKDSAIQVVKLLPKAPVQKQPVTIDSSGIKKITTRVKPIVQTPNKKDSAIQVVKLLPKTPVQKQPVTIDSSGIKKIQTRVNPTVITPAKKDSAIQVVKLLPKGPVQKQPVTIDSSGIKKITTGVNPSVQSPNKKDTIALASKIMKSDSSYGFNPAEPQYLVILFNKVDPVFTNEARTAFNRYNMEFNSDKKINLTSFTLSADYGLLLIGPFNNAEAANGYFDQIRPVVSSRIIPWLTRNKYSFSIISESNLFIIKNKKNVPAYTSFIHQYFPDKY